MYDPMLVQPMKEELVQLGIQELLTPEEVDRVMAKAEGTTLVVVNSVCGCAAGKARPGVALALQHGIQPDRKLTVFAGQEREATARMREYFTGYPPSSPQIALMRGTEVVFMMERRDIEGRDAYAIAGELTAAFDQFCGANAQGGKPMSAPSGAPAPAGATTAPAGRITLNDLAGTMKQHHDAPPHAHAHATMEAGGNGEADRKWWQVWK